MYDWKWAEEAKWLLLTALATTLLQELVTFDAALVLDWRTWAVSLGSACVRAVAVAGLAAFGKARLA